MADARSLIVGALAAALLLTSCSSGTGQQLASNLEDAAAATASLDLSLRQVQDGRSTTAAAITLAQNMRDKVVQARDGASTLTAPTPQDRQARATALTTLDNVLTAVLKAQDAVSDGNRPSMGGIRARLRQLTAQARAEATRLKGGSL